MKTDSTAQPPADKAAVRRELRARLQALSSPFRAEASLVICDLAAHLPAFRDARAVALFAPLASEPDIHPLIEEAWARKKIIALPRLWREHDTPHLAWHAVKNWSEVVEPGPFGLREPEQTCPRVTDIDCVFVPGLAFDNDGLRLGRGGGYYDRFLSQVSPSIPRFGLMFATQRVEKLPREPHDQALPAVVTEEGIVSFAGVRSIQPPPSTSSPT